VKKKPMLGETVSLSWRKILKTLRQLTRNLCGLEDIGFGVKIDTMGHGVAQSVGIL
jgi:hypothetical protein